MCLMKTLKLAKTLGCCFKKVKSVCNVEGVLHVSSIEI